MITTTQRVLLSLAAVAAVATTGARLTYYEESLPGTLNPIYASSMVDYRVDELIFDRLYYHSPITNELTSRLVDTWEVAESGKAVRLTLRRDAKWHDGTNLGAEDVCFTVNAMLDTGTTSPIAEGYRAELAGCEVESKNVALVRFQKIFHNPLNRLSFYVLPSHVFDGTTAIPPDHEFSNRPMGTGSMKGSMGRSGVSFEAVKNGHHSAGVDLVLQEGNDPLVQVKTLMQDGVQGIVAVPPGRRPDVTASDQLALKSYDLRSWWYVAVNDDKPYLKDRRVRQALNQLIDRTDLRQLSLGIGPDETNSPCEFISGPFVQSSPYYNRAIATQPRSDREAAFAMLKQAGLTQEGGRWHYKGQPITLRIGMKAPLDNEAPDLLSQLGNQLGAAGFDRQTHKISTDDWNTKVETGQMSDYDLLIGKWSFGLVEDVNALFHTRKGSRGSKNIFNFSNTQVDVLLAQYDAARTDTQAQDAYHKLHEALSVELPYLFLWKLDTKSAWRTEVRGTTIAPYYYWTEVDAWTYSP